MAHSEIFSLSQKTLKIKITRLNYILRADLSFRYECHSAVHLNGTKTSSMPESCVTEPPIFIQNLRNKQATADGHQTVGLQLGKLVGS